MINNYMIYKNLPQLDLHGQNRYSARVEVNEFISNNNKLKNKLIIIVHGKGKSILKEEVHKILKTNKLVKDYKIDIFNDGQTIVELK